MMREHNLLSYRFILNLWVRAYDEMNKYCKIKNDMMHNRQKINLSSTEMVLFAFVRATTGCRWWIFWGWWLRVYCGVRSIRAKENRFSDGRLFCVSVLHMHSIWRGGVRSYRYECVTQCVGAILHTICDIHACKYTIVFYVCMCGGGDVAKRIFEVVCLNVLVSVWQCGCAYMYCSE